MNRTQEEIVARIEKRREQDFLGFEWHEYAAYLDAEHVKPFLKDGGTEEPWVADTRDLVEVMEDYMAFAWGKANNERGISANRSISHYIAWLWLAEEEELLAAVEQEFRVNYQHYGKEILVMICERFGWDWKQWDNGIRTNG